MPANPHCPRCDGLGTKDHAGFAMKPCECVTDPHRAIDPIVRAIAHKAADDVSAAIARNMLLVQPGSPRAQVALLACSSALAAASMAFLAVNEELGAAPTSGDEAADALWDLMKPMTVKAINGTRRA